MADTTIGISGAMSLAEGNDGVTNFEFTVTRSGDVSGAAAVDYYLWSDQADGADFTGSTAGTVYFEAGETSKTITIAALGDAAVEADETFHVSLANARGGTIDAETATAVILNDDASGEEPPPEGATVSIGGGGSVTEGDSGSADLTFTVTRSSGAGEAAVDYFLWSDQTDASDFTGSTGGTVYFADGETSKTITIAAAGDTAVEGDETFNVSLANARGMTIDVDTAHGVIVNDDEGGEEPPPDGATISIEGAGSVMEGDDGAANFTFTVTRSSGTGEAAVDYFLWSDQADASDFTGSTGGTVYFADGETSKTITIAAAGDTAVEGNETFNVSLANARGATIDVGTAQGTIVDDDSGEEPPPPDGTVSISGGGSVTEGDDGAANFTFTVTRTSGAGEAAVDYFMWGGQADASDFTGPTGGTVYFADGETSKTITIAAAGDTAVEDDEAFNISLANARGVTIATDTAQGVIVNDDEDTPPPASTLAISGGGDVTEGDSGSTEISFTVTRSGDTSGAASVDYYVRGTADSEDFAGPTGGTVSFAAGETSKTVTLAVAGDTTAEADEGFGVFLTNAVGATIDGGAASASGTILDDDSEEPPPEATLSLSGGGSMAEGDEGATAFTFTVTRDGDASGQALVDYYLWGEADAADFTGATTGTVVFDVGETSKQITISAAGDTVAEPDEGFQLVLVNARGAVLGTATANAVITDDDGWLVG